MKLQLTAVILLVFLSGITAAGEEPALKTQKDKVSYAIGLKIGTDIKNQSIDIDPNILAKGVSDALISGKLLLTDDELRETLTALQKDLSTKQQEHIQALLDKNKNEGTAFLEGNKKKEDVKTTPSGLQYKVIKEGTGKTPKASDTVKVNYSGKLINGTEFDSSYKRGEPVTFQVGGVIAGWTEALQLMKEGAKWQLFIPSNLAYGETGAGNVIEPNSVLIFEVELLSITEKTAK
ncbi:MAG: FKBP-type peptidyl-prolyl cis-trans isomerase [Nitrospirae bacterium]|nr:FKBP-type peptidyl-prolyl cis-trans isomerase [Nitrospirota bacterium]